jgi:hypothetical protein
MKWIRRLLVCAALAVLLIVIAGGFGYRLLHRQPDWYAHDPIDPVLREQLAQRVEDKITYASNWSQSAWLAKQQPATGQPPAPLELALTDEEINAFLSKWEKLSTVNARLAGVLSDPRVSFDDGQIALAATIEKLQTVATVHLVPRIDDKGYVHADVEKVTGGQLPLPEAVWSVYADKLAAKIVARLPREEQRATMYRDGSANDQMVFAVLGKMMVQLLHGAPASPLVFLKYTANNELRNLPVKITSVKIAGKTLTVTFEPLAAGEKVGE